MRQPFNPGLACKSRYPGRRFHVYGIEGLATALHVEANSVHGAVGSVKGGDN
jgi:hypothetical protein